jgi:hypothetical protein
MTRAVPTQPSISTSEVLRPQHRAYGTTKISNTRQDHFLLFGQAQFLETIVVINNVEQSWKATVVVKATFMCEKSP